MYIYLDWYTVALLQAAGIDVSDRRRSCRYGHLIRGCPRMKRFLDHRLRCG